MKALASAAFAASLAAASAAHAVIAPFGGAATGTDPLGHSWVASNTFGSAWGEPGNGLGELTFNPGDLSSGAGDWANRFSFIFLEGVSGAINTGAVTEFYDATTGQTWATQFVGGDKVVFTAPTGSRISAGDKFFVNVGFTGPVDTAKFSFAGLWTDIAGTVPEPGTWALMIAGFGLAGATLRRRRTAALAV